MLYVWRLAIVIRDVLNFASLINVKFALGEVQVCFQLLRFTHYL